MDIRRNTRANVNVMMAGLLAYTLIFTAAAYLHAFLIGDDGYWLTIAGVVCGLFMLRLYTRKTLPLKAVFFRGKEMSAAAFIQFLCVFGAGQMIFTAWHTLLEYGLNIIGFSTYTSVLEATGTSMTFSRFLYASFLVPVTEELIYRGMCLRMMQRFGRVFAIVFSAALFGIMHANLPQSGFAFYIGLVLGYVAMEYSIVWAMVLHFINNFVFGEFLGLIMEPFDMIIQNAVYYLLFGAFFVCGVIVVILRRKDIAAYLVAHRAAERTYLYAFTALMSIIFIVMHLTEALLLLDRL